MKLQRWRELAGLTQEEAAAFISGYLPDGQAVTNGAISRYESGERIPDRNVMKAIMQATANAVTANDFYS